MIQIPQVNLKHIPLIILKNNLKGNYEIVWEDGKVLNIQLSLF